jgi:hypothetical protein
MRMALAAGTTARARIDAVAADKFKAVIREAAAKAAQEASLKRSRDNVDNPAPSPTPSAPPARTRRRSFFEDRLKTMLGLWRTRDTEFRIKVKLGFYLYDEDLDEGGKPYGDHRGLERN